MLILTLPFFLGLQNVVQLAVAFVARAWEVSFFHRIKYRTALFFGVRAFSVSAFSDELREFSHSRYKIVFFEKVKAFKSSIENPGVSAT